MHTLYTKIHLMYFIDYNKITISKLVTWNVPIITDLYFEDLYSILITCTQYVPDEGYSETRRAHSIC